MTGTYAPRLLKADICLSFNLTSCLSVVIKLEKLAAIATGFNMKKLLGISFGLSALFLSGCAQVSSVQPGTPIVDVLKQYGRPNVSCPSRDGGKRMVWSQQPDGETAYALHVSKQGLVGAPLQVLTDKSFSILGNGEVWTRERVHCEFGPPANITRDNWGNDQQWIWGYRYLDSSGEAQIMYVYLGNEGTQVTKFRSLPDAINNPEIAEGITLYRW